MNTSVWSALLDMGLAIKLYLQRMRARMTQRLKEMALRIAQQDVVLVYEREAAPPPRRQELGKRSLDKGSAMAASERPRALAS